MLNPNRTRSWREAQEREPGLTERKSVIAR
jgi:hypothetical protein